MGLYLKKELENEAVIGVWQITETEEELKELSSTPSDEMEEISFIRSESLRKQRLAVRALLNTLFDDKVYLSHHDNGKPYIENNPINISITHTAKYVAVILHEEENVGIDIESLDRDFSAVEKKALSEDEIDDLEDDEKRNEQLAIYWCAKEAVYKLLSRYNVDFAEQIEIERFRPRGEGELEATFTSKNEEEEFDLEYITFDRHVLVWVVGE